VSAPTPTELTVDPASEGERLDLYVGRALGISRARLKSLFDAGAVRVEGRRARKGQTVRAGERVAVEIAQEDPRPVPEPDRPLHVLHSDDALVAVDKPSGWPSHPLVPGERGTVANALVARFPECLEASEDPREGGLCHRLDVQTSGVLLAARKRNAWARMRQAFSGRGIDKRYWALVAGPIADEGEIDLPLRHAPRHPDRVEAAPDGRDAREALTIFRVLARAGEYSLVEARILTGVLHQVRAHFAGIGAALVGDAQYGGAPLTAQGQERFFLHARSLTFEHPESGAPLQVEAPLSGEWTAVLRRLAIDLPLAPPRP
jgi:23S rRNA pseudouridine1911/1915/1917 synthase